MTAAELIRNVLTVCGKRTVCVNRNDWHYNDDKLPHQTTTKYDIWIEPGLKGTKGEHYYGNSIEELAEKVGEVVSDQLMNRAKGDSEESDKNVIEWAVNVYSNDMVTLLETYTLCKSKADAEETLKRDAEQLGKRKLLGHQIRIDKVWLG